MRKIHKIIIVTLAFLFPVIVWASVFGVQQGGTGYGNIQNGAILVGSTTQLNMATSTDLHFFSIESFAGAGFEAFIIGTTTYDNGRTNDPVGASNGGGLILAPSAYNYTQALGGGYSSNGTGSLKIQSLANGSFVQGFSGNTSTHLTPTASAKDDILLGLVARGFASTDYPNTSRVRIELNASENWSDTNQGTYIRFITTPNGTTARAEVMRIDQNGYVGIGTTSPGTSLSIGNTGANTINISETATSTFGSGINISTGCFAISNVCVTGGGASLSGGSPNTLTYWTSGTTVSATGTPTVTAITATSSTATSTFAGALTYTDGSTDTALTLKQYGANLVIASTTLSTGATSSPLYILSGTGQGQMLVNGGTAALPAYSFIGNNNTGISRTAASTMVFSTGGSARATLNTVSFTINSGTIRNGNGSASTPTYSFTNGTQAGMYWTGANAALAGGGAEDLNLGTGAVGFRFGTAAAPSINFITNTEGGSSAAGTGIFFINNPTLGFTVGGGEKMRIDNSGNMGIGTSTGDSTLDVAGSVRVEGVSSIETGSLGGAIVGLGCDTINTTASTTLASTTALITNPEKYPGNGLFWYSYVLNSTTITTNVCSDVTVTPTASAYVIKIIK